MPQRQKYPGWCGVNSIRNSLLSYGTRYSQVKVSGDVDWSEGMDEHDVTGRVAELGFRTDELNTRRRQDAREWLKKWGHLAPMILCVDEWRHWVTIMGGCGDRLILVDGSNDPGVKLVQLLTPKTILKRWRAARRVAEGDGLYYGIVVLRGTYANSDKR